MTFEDRYQALCADMLEDARRRRHDRILVIITEVNEPAPSHIDEADYLHLNVLSTLRLREMAEIYAREYRDPWGIEPTARNVRPELGAQLTIDQQVFENVIPGHWGYDRDEEDLDLDYLESCLSDIVHALTGYYALIVWRC